ncbi:MAG: alpha,alpha-trehalase [Rhodothermia bacterium]|nr:alpha,alpha-trehalase [Rhodothermia bacterium]
MIELPGAEHRSPMLEYIKKSWGTLTRSHSDLLKALVDPKVEHAEGEPWTLYVSAKEDPDAVLKDISRSLSADELNQIRVKRLPENPREHMADISPHGLLYLPHPYVVPGGRFNEMYGWDSYFIQVGLLQDDEIELAKNMIDNFVYQIEHYGTILNANRSYYLTRSQPPFLTAMILGVYEKTRDRAWLESTLPAIESYHEFWFSSPHLIENLGLSRYYGLGSGPAPEVIADEKDEAGRTHYDRIREYYRTTPVDQYDLSMYYDAATDRLTPLFYVGDRSMRESGFDPSNRFGPFNIDIIHFAPVCLNSLLYRMEMEAATIYGELGRETEAEAWTALAQRRAELVNRYLWDDDRGLYMDYDMLDEELSDYEFATTFYPLWVGIASKEQARRVAANLYLFEAPGGLLTSTSITGNQWDAPFGWAPLQMIAVQGLRRYGYHADADRLTAKFVGLVSKEFDEHGVIVEKYDLVQRESDVEAGIKYGYAANQIGFGWTNAVVLELLKGMKSR